MAEYEVTVWTRRIPLLGDPGKLKDFRVHTVKVWADDFDHALKRAHDAERAGGDKRLRVFVQVDTGYGFQGLGDMVLMESIGKFKPK